MTEQIPDTPAKRSSVWMSLPFLFTLGAVIFSISFMLSSFPLGRTAWRQKEVQKVYFADNIGSAHAEIIRSFNEAYAGKIEVVPVNLSFQKFNTNQRKELIARNLRSRSSRIDVFSVDLIWVPRFTKWAEPLAPYFSSAFLDEMLDFSLETCYVDGSLYALPLYIDIGVMYYRKDLIRALPNGAALEEKLLGSISWSEFLELGHKYFPDRPFYAFQGEAYEGLICNFNEFLGYELQDRRTGEFRDLLAPQVIERLAFMRQLIHTEGAAPLDVVHFTEDAALEYALANDIPFVRGWPTVNNEIDQRFDPEKFPLLAIAPLPHFEGDNPTPVFGGWNLMLSKHSPVKEEALLFMEFASSRAGQDVFFQANSPLPILKTYYTAGENSDERLTQLGHMMEYGLFRPFHPEYTRISDILANHIHRTLTGELSVREALETAQALITEELDQSTQVAAQ